MSTVVVGSNGSKGSVEALRYAIDEARLHDARVKVVNALHIPAIVYEAGWAPVLVDRSACAKQCPGRTRQEPRRGRRSGVRSRGDDRRRPGTSRERYL